MTYKFRGLPSTGMNWCVCGCYSSSGGVLEWCYSEEDAHTLMGRMQQDPRFRNLHVERADTWISTTPVPREP